MKNLKSLIVIIFAVFAMNIGFSQTPPHPNGGNDPGSGNTPVGGGAPIAGGFFIMLSLGLGYGAKKMYDIRRKSVK